MPVKNITKSCASFYAVLLEHGKPQRHSCKWSGYRAIPAQLRISVVRYASFLLACIRGDFDGGWLT